MNAVDAVIAAVIAALKQAPAVCGAIDEDVDAEAVPEGVAEFVNVRHESSVPINRAGIRGAPKDWSTDVAVECYARNDSAAAGERASRALQAKVYARLLGDTNLGGAALDVLDPNITTDTDRADRRNGCSIGVYTVIHRTAGASLEAAA